MNEKHVTSFLKGEDVGSFFFLKKKTYVSQPFLFFKYIVEEHLHLVNMRLGATCALLGLLVLTLLDSAGGFVISLIKEHTDVGRLEPC